MIGVWLIPTTGEGWGLLVLVVVVLAATVAWLAWLGRADRNPVQVDDAAAPLPLYVRSWLVVDVRVRHDVLGLGTVLDPTPSHAPYAGQVLVRFDTLSAPRWIRPRELDPVTALDEERLREIDRRRASRAVFLQGPRSNGERVRQVWPATCGDRGGCYWHGEQCGASFVHEEPAFCCVSCPARGGAR